MKSYAKSSKLCKKRINRHHFQWKTRFKGACCSFVKIRDLREKRRATNHFSRAARCTSYIYTRPLYTLAFALVKVISASRLIANKNPSLFLFSSPLFRDRVARANKPGQREKEREREGKIARDAIATYIYIHALRRKAAAANILSYSRSLGRLLLERRVIYGVFISMMSLPLFIGQ